MLRELTELFAAVPPDATWDDYAIAIVKENALGKQTYATGQSSRQRLTEMYGLDPGSPSSASCDACGGSTRMAVLCSPCSVRPPAIRCSARPRPLYSRSPREKSWSAHDS